MLTLENYLEQKGFTEKKTQTIKMAVIEILMAICASDSSIDEIKDGLKLQWRTVIGSECKEEDVAFINEFDFKYQNYVLYDKIKYHGFGGIKNKSFCLNYIRSVWFFCFLGMNYESIDRDEIAKVVAELKEKDRENGFFKDERFYVLDSLYKRYGCYSDRAREIGEKISDKYLDELKDIFQESVEMLIDEDDRYSEIEHIFVLEKEEAAKAEPKAASTTVKKEEAKVEAPVKEVAPVEDISEDDVQEDDEITILINKIKEQHNIEIQKLKEAYEAKINALAYEIDLERAKYEKADDEIKRARIKGAEEILLTLNSDSYSCILDKLFEIKATQKVANDEIINLSVQFYNALRALGYKTVQWHGQKCGDIIPSDTPVTDLRKYYRWDENLNLDGKERVVKYPGLKYSKSRLVVYNPKIDEKK